MNIDDAKAMLTELREWAFPEATEALDIALWLMEREEKVEALLRVASEWTRAFPPGTQLPSAITAVREHPRPGST